MTAVAAPNPSAEVEFILRTASCLGAIGYSPHEVQRIVASELHADPHVVAHILRAGTSGSVCVDV